MATLLFLLGGIAGGALSLAFLLGVLITEPAAFVMIMLIAWGIWKLTGIPWTKAGRAARRENQMVEYQQVELDDQEEW